jgi:ribulose-phosphate 3-epimerase
MPTIVPAILEETREGLEDKLFQITRVPGVERVQIDFADGEFVEHKTLGVTEFDSLNPAFHWEAHLMTKPPHNFLDYQIAGFKTIILHYEAFGKEEHLDDTLTEIKKCGLIPALAINPETPVSVLRYFGDTIQHFTVLSVHPGSQGQSFLEETYERVTELRNLIPHAIIEVDGGISQENIGGLIAAGSDLLAVGSALFETEDLNKNYSELASVATQKNEK